MPASPERSGGPDGAVIEAWLLPLGPGPDDAGLELLDESERARWARFVFPEDRRLFAAAHALLRCALSRFTCSRSAPRDPRAWRFRANPWGRPELAPSQEGPGWEGPLSFNLTHCRGLVACAVARGAGVGIDAEWLGRALDQRGLAESVFTPRELAQLDTAPPAHQAETFFALWTLKEAYVKARGRGLSLALDTFTVQAHPPSIEPAPDDPAAWHAALHRATPDHLVAVAAPRTATPCQISWRLVHDLSAMMQPGT